MIDYSKVNIKKDTINFKWFLWSEFKNLQTLTRKTCDYLGTLPPKEGEHKSLKKTIYKEVRVLLINLYEACILKKWVSIRINNRAFCNSAGNKNRFSYNKTFLGESVRIRIRQLVELNLIHFHKGYFDLKTNKGVTSKIAATEKLQKLFNGSKLDEITITTIDYQTIDGKNYRPIPLKDVFVFKEYVPNSDGKDLKVEKKQIDYYKNLKDIHGWSNERIQNHKKALKVVEDEVLKYNELLRNIHIDALMHGYKHTGKRYSELIILASKEVYRVFNYGSVFPLGGGRFYGSWIMTAPREVRSRLFINGEEAHELDYSGMHLRLALWLEGTSYTELFGDSDPYTLPNVDPSLRALFKRIVLTAFNATTRGKCLNAVLNDMEFKPDLFPGIQPEWKDRKFINKYLTKFIERYEVISNQFFSGVGTRLMLLDSNIAHAIIKHFTKKGICCLCMHDSFLVQKDHSRELRHIMKQAWIAAYKHQVPDSAVIDFPVIDEKDRYDFSAEQTNPKYQEEINNLKERNKLFQVNKVQNNTIRISKYIIGN